MSRIDKRLERMRNNPRDWRIDELQSMAKRLGIDCRNDGGSHHVFSHPGVDFDLSVPVHRPIKPVYIRQFVALIERVRRLEG